MTLLRRVIELVRPYRGFLALAFLGALGETVADLLQPWPLKLLFDSVFNHRPLPRGTPEFVARWIGQPTAGLLSFVLLAVLAIAALSAASSWAQDFFMPRISHW